MTRLQIIMRSNFPKRDLLPSQASDHVTRALDDAYERGARLGWRMGLARAIAEFKDQPRLVAHLERLKNEKL